jgi:hypothetical protein
MISIFLRYIFDIANVIYIYAHKLCGGTFALTGGRVGIQIGGRGTMERLSSRAARFGVDSAIPVREDE